MGNPLDEIGRQLEQLAHDHVNHHDVLVAYYSVAAATEPDPRRRGRLRALARMELVAAGALG